MPDDDNVSYVYVARDDANKITGWTRYPSTECPEQIAEDDPEVVAFNEAAPKPAL